MFIVWEKTGVDGATMMGAGALLAWRVFTSRRCKKVKRKCHSAGLTGNVELGFDQLAFAAVLVVREETLHLLAIN